ncbi:hypothetical protein FRX31_015635 [Thalictrum thalictroides]|uniref:Uncharacterized protein n=1 Tax=Thalictrum thalictroides TaxID=46969 RepID=A0A7J6WDU8_THATH|nr:hypothetical protein FRX31_015635 [Thalictrum thalictroides]
MYVLTEKLKMLKHVLRKWSKNKISELMVDTNASKEALEIIQYKLHNDCLNARLQQQEKLAMEKYTEAVSNELKDLKQRSKCKWDLEGDGCTVYYHNFVKERNSKNSFWSLDDKNGNRTSDNDQVCRIIENYYIGLLGFSSISTPDRDFFNNLQVKRADPMSLITVMSIMDILALETGLNLNVQKTTLLVAGLPEEEAMVLAQKCGIQLVKPPVTYLGLPLISSRLSVKNYQPIIERITKRISN